MSKSIVVATALIVAVSLAPARAQTTAPRTQTSVWGGWVFSDGVETTNAILAPDGNVYNRVDPKDSAIFGVNFGVLVTPNSEFGFMFSRQFSSLVLGGTTDRNIGDMNIDNYHGYFQYNFFDEDAKVRPFALIGFGATSSGEVNTPNRLIPGQTRFSTTWGAGVNVFPAPHIGFRAAAQWTPTYIKSDSAGWWCDPFWGCYVVGDPQYANQFHFNGGVTFRF